MENLINSYIDKGISVVLSIVVVIFLGMLIKYFPKWFEDYVNVIKHSAIATDNNTKIMSKVSEVIENTEAMHVQMESKMDEQHRETDEKMNSILEQIKSLSEIIETNEKADDDFKRVIMKEINKLKVDFEELKRTQ